MGQFVRFPDDEIVRLSPGQGGPGVFVCAGAVRKAPGAAVLFSRLWCLTLRPYAAPRPAGTGGTFCVFARARRKAPASTANSTRRRPQPAESGARGITSPNFCEPGAEEIRRNVEPGSTLVEAIEDDRVVPGPPEKLFFAHGSEQLPRTLPPRGLFRGGGASSSSHPCSCSRPPANDRTTSNPPMPDRLRSWPFCARGLGPVALPAEAPARHNLGLVRCMTYAPAQMPVVVTAVPAARGRIQGKRAAHTAEVLPGPTVPSTRDTFPTLAGTTAPPNP